MKYCDKCFFLHPKEHEQTDRRVDHACDKYKMKIFHLGKHPHLPRPTDCPEFLWVRAFRTRCLSVDHIVFESTASKARYAVFELAQMYDIEMGGIRVVRAPEYDVMKTLRDLNPVVGMLYKPETLRTI